MAYVTIASSQVDADSPLDTTLMVQIKDNEDDLDSRAVTNGDAHDHEGGDGAVIPQGGIKSTTGTIQSNSTTLSDIILPGGEYGFYPQIKTPVVSITIEARIALSRASTVFITNIAIRRAGGGATPVTVQQRYIQSSPPYNIGNEEWGHFVFLLQNINTNDIFASYEAPEPPWAYNGKTWLDKNDSSRINTVPHPFGDYYDKDPSVDGLKISLLDTRGKDMKKWRRNNVTPGKGLIESFSSESVGSTKTITLPDIPNFSGKVKIREFTS